MSNKARVQKLVDDGLADESLLSIAEDADRYGALKALTDLPGGKILRDALAKDITTVVHKLTANYHTLSHTEFIALSAQMDAQLTLLRILANAKTNAEILDKELRDTLG